MQSRYYDPALGRFLNADSYASTGQGFLGYNMFAYCGNNPSCCVDPTGTVSWWGTLLGAAEIVGGLFTMWYDGGALLTTGAVTTTAALSDGVMVMDLSGSCCGQKYGDCVVIDFGENTVETYEHYGTIASSDPSPSISYSVGLIENYNSFGDYAGSFVEADLSLTYLGLSVCASPDDPRGAYATCISFSPSASVSVSLGYDYYISTGQYSLSSSKKTNTNQAKAAKPQKARYSGTRTCVKGNINCIA